MLPDSDPSLSNPCGNRVSIRQRSLDHEGARDRVEVCISRCQLTTHAHAQSFIHSNRGVFIRTNLTPTHSFAQAVVAGLRSRWTSRTHFRDGIALGPPLGSRTNDSTDPKPHITSYSQLGLQVRKKARRKMIANEIQSTEAISPSRS